MKITRAATVFVGAFVALMPAWAWACWQSMVPKYDFLTCISVAGVVGALLAGVLLRGAESWSRRRRVITTLTVLSIAFGSATFFYMAQPRYNTKFQPANKFDRGSVKFVTFSE